MKDDALYFFLYATIYLISFFSPRDRFGISLLSEGVQVLA